MAEGRYCLPHIVITRNVIHFKEDINYAEEKQQRPLYDR